ncbi:class I SAM-dependent methyltransferase [Paenibacillus sp. TRM 82003]|nr:class I SAM-dependent methyltransferase [Paenibacillus sp. TRM 82003]
MGMMQEELAKANKAAWETKAYRAWVARYGTPDELAASLKREHRHLLRYWLPHLDDPNGKRVLNLLGSHGRKAISLALMGAEVTVVDISEENRAYALASAAAAGVPLDYVCADVLAIPDEERLGAFDVVLMEFGILHYFTELTPLFDLAHRRLRSGGRLLLTDFHPFARAWLTTDNLKMPSGDYFDSAVKESEVAFAKLLLPEEREGLGKVMGRGWTMGAIVTAAASAGLTMKVLEEIPCKTDSRFPEFYTLVADRPSAG